MAYGTQADLEAAIGADIVLRLLDDTQSGTVSATALASVVARASAIIDSYVVALYGSGNVAAYRETPPDIAKTIFVAIASQLCFERRPEFRNERGDSPVQSSFKWAMDYLKSARDLKDPTRLDAGATPAPPANVGGSAEQGNNETLTETGVGMGVFKDGFGDF